MRTSWYISMPVIIAMIFAGSCSRRGVDVQTTSPPETPGASAEGIFVEEIPGSRVHSPDGTWWGYNQNKIVRYNDAVYMYVIDNSGRPHSPSKLTVYRKEGNGAWERGAAFDTSRPGNLLVDSTGVLHAFVFEAVDLAQNDSLGRLWHYWFPNSPAGDIQNYEREIVIDNDGSTENVNIRIGAAIGPDDRMAVAFGLTEGNRTDLTTEQEGHTEHLYFRESGGHGWTHLVAGTNLGHDFYYPFVLVTREGFSLLPVQDDYPFERPDNVYHIIPFFNYDGKGWRRETIVDYSTHALAPRRTRLTEQSDLFLDSRGVTHIIYKSFLGDTDYQVSQFHYLRGSYGDWQEITLDPSPHGLNWLRIFESDGELYLLGVSWNEAFLARVDTLRWHRIKLPKPMSGIYPYVADAQGGTRAAEAYVDILLLNGDSQAYPDPVQYYVRVAKQLLQGLE